MRHAAPLLMIGFGALAGCHRASPEECTELLDRYVSQKLLGDATLVGKSDREKFDIVTARVRENHQSPTYRARHAQCTREVSRRQVQCAMAAGNLDEWEACLD